MGKLTREEHDARAMLLGMHHVNMSAGYYFKSGRPFIRLDMITLEPISEKEAERRNAQVAKTGKYYHD